jgi:hypothetical protein
MLSHAAQAYLESRGVAFRIAGSGYHHCTTCRRNVSAASGATNMRSFGDEPCIEVTM